MFAGNAVAAFEFRLAFWATEGERLFSRLTPDLPPHLWWLAFIVLLILGLTALIDAVKARVPDPPIVVGLLLFVTALGYDSGWLLVGQRLGLGLTSAIVLWGLNEIYYLMRKHDALGMGDAKWTALAVTTFTLKPVIWAWVVGAWLGLAWLAVAWLPRALYRLFSSSVAPYKPRYVHFAPFLFVGLLASLYWHYLR